MSASPVPDQDSLSAFSTRATPLSPSRVPGQPDALAKTGEYSIFGLTPAADQTVLRGRQLGFTLVLFGVATVIALLYSVERYFYSRVVGTPVSLTQLVPAELVFTYTWALLTPLVMAGPRRFPVWGRPNAGHWAIQISALVAFVIVHLALFSLATVLLDSHVTLSVLPTLFGQSLLTWTVLDSLVFCAIVVVHHAVVYYRV